MSPESEVAPRPARPVLSPLLHWRIYLWTMVAVPAFMALNDHRGASGFKPGPLQPADATSIGLVLTAVASITLIASQLRTIGTRRSLVGGPLLVLVVAGYVANGLFSVVTPPLNHIAVILSIVAPLVVPRLPPAWLAQEVHRALYWIYGAGTAVALVLLPSWAMPASGITKLPVLDRRLSGLGGHPNTLGTLLVIMLLLETLRPATPGRRARTCLVLVLLVLTQSYTSWAAGALAVTVTFGFTHRSSRRLVRWALAVFAAGMVAMILSVGTSEPPDVEESAGSLTGRTAIWSATLDAWRDEPVFGLGGRLWNDEMDQRYADRVGIEPGHAHNQFVNTLGQAGIVGSVALVAYLWRVGILLRRQPERLAPTAHGLVVVVGVTMLTEVPLRFGLVTSSSIVHLTVLAMLLAGSDYRAEVPERRERSPLSPLPS